VVADTLVFFYCSIAMPNGVSKSQDDMSVAEIKERAKAQAQKVSRGASPLSLIGVARTQIAQARAAESSGDLKTAYSAYIKAVSLVQTFMGSPELKAESAPGKRGVLWKEYSDFQTVSSCSDLALDELETDIFIG
jgi:ubiquitin carboxyl-terminal hydrolase 8